MCHRGVTAAVFVALVTVNVFGADAKIDTFFGELPLTFEANRGQLDARVLFAARGAGYGLFLTQSEAVLDLRGAVLRMHPVHANRSAAVAGVDVLPGRSNYYRTRTAGRCTVCGLDMTARYEDIPHYASVRYAGVYRGIDLIYHGNQRELEYDFVVAPGADPSLIRVAFDGIDRLRIDPSGDLVLRLGGREVRQHQPVMYQEVNGVRHFIDGRYVIAGRKQIAFAIGTYDRTLPLVVDPVVSYGTYLGGTDSDIAKSIAVDEAGNVYITGQTQSNDFPIVISPPDPIPAGPNYLLFVAKLNATGTTLLYSDWFANNLTSYNIGNGIRVDSNGNAYVTGQYGDQNGFNTALVLRLDASGHSAYGVSIGGGGDTSGNAIAIDGGGYAYVTGLADTPFYVTPAAYQTLAGGSGDAFVMKVNTNVPPDTSSIIYSTLLGGASTDAGNAIAVDASGNAYVAGETLSSVFPLTASAFQSTYGGGLRDAFFTKVNANGTALLYSTLFGGGSFDAAYGIALDSAGYTYIAGGVNGTGLPTTASAYQTAWSAGDCRLVPADPFTPCYDAFVAKLNSFASGAASLVYSTYLGGPGSDIANAIAVDEVSHAYIGGSTTPAYSPAGSFPTASPIASFNAANSTGFVAELGTASPTLLFSTYFTAAPESLVRDAAGGICIAGGTTATTGISTSGVYQMTNQGLDDAFVARIGGFAVPTITTQPLSQTIQPYTTTTMTVAATGSGLTYQWYFGTSGVTASPIGAATTTSYMTPSSVNTTRYWAKVSNSAGNVASRTATITVAFVDDPLASGLTKIRAVHVLDLRIRINGLRARYGKAGIVFPTLTAGVTKILPQDITDMRAALGEVYTAAGRPAPTYTPIAAGTAATKTFIAEIRAAITAIE